MAITGYDAVSLQPNAGSQGEFAGLLAIRAYHRSRGDDGQRRVPDPLERPRHQRGERGDGRAEGGGRALRRRRQRRPRRPRGQGRRRRRRAGRGDGHLPVDARRVRGQASASCARSSTTTAGRCTSTAPTSTRWSASPSPASSVPMSATSTCTRRSASPTAAAGPGVGPVAVARPPRPVPARASAGVRRPAGRRRRRGTVRLGQHPVDLVGVHRADGRAGLTDASAIAVLNANYIATRLAPALPGALHGRARPCRPRVHRRPAADHQGHRRHGRRCRQASDRLRVPRPDDELPGQRHVDDRADRERVVARARPVLRGDDRDQGRDRRGRRGNLGRGRPARCATLRTPPRISSASGIGPTIASSAPTRSRRCGREVLPAGVAHRRRVRRPQPRSAAASRSRRLPQHRAERVRLRCRHEPEHSPRHR